MEYNITIVGLDAHKNSIEIVTAETACICRKAAVHLLLQPCGLDLPGDDQIKFGLGM